MKPDEQQLEIFRLREERDEFAAALRGLLVAFPGDYTEPPDHIVNARAALAKLK